MSAPFFAAEELRQHRGLDHRGQDRVGPDVLRSQSYRQGLHQQHDAPLVIEYSGLYGEPTSPDTEEVKMIEPLPSAARSNGSAYLVAKKALRWLTSTALAH